MWQPTPDSLEVGSYEVIRLLMVGASGTEPHRPSAACSLFEEALYREAFDDVDETFSRQMSDICGNPDVYFVTANSAIPVADSVRGYFGELGLPMPPIYPIRADSTRSRRLAYRESSDFGEEVRLMSQLLEGDEHVCVIDQFVHTGKTLKYAAAVLSEVGISIGSAIRGNWYYGAHITDIDFENVTSRHAAEMYDIGALAARTFATAA